MKPTNNTAPLANGNPFEKGMPFAPTFPWCAAEMTIETKTIDKLTPMIQCETLDYGAHGICKVETLFSKTVYFDHGYSAELRVTAGNDGDPLCVNMRLLLNNEVVYDDHDGEDVLLGQWDLEHNGISFLVSVREAADI